MRPAQALGLISPLRGSDMQEMESYVAIGRHFQKMFPKCGEKKTSRVLTLAYIIPWRCSGWSFPFGQRMVHHGARCYVSAEPSTFAAGTGLGTPRLVGK